MITLKKILVPTDFSEHSAKAMLYGSELARKFGAELHLMHAVEMTPLMYGEGAYVTPERKQKLKRSRRSSSKTCLPIRVAT